MPALNAEVGSAVANSYVELDFAQSYFTFSTRKDAWDVITDKEARLIESARLLDVLFIWNGYKSSTTQSMEWPRTGVYIADSEYVDSAIIPVAVMQAQCELAIFIEENGGLNLEDDPVSAVKVGPISVKYTDRLKSNGIPNIVKLMLKRYGIMQSESNNSVKMVKLVR